MRKSHIKLTQQPINSISEHLTITPESIELKRTLEKYFCPDFQESQYDF